MVALIEDPVKELTKDNPLGKKQARAGECSRCGGLMVAEQYGDLAVRRCVQCGDLIDPVILSNRRRRLLTGVLSLVLILAGAAAPVLAAPKDLQAEPSELPAAGPFNAEVAGVDGKDWHTATIELPPGAADSWQSHPGGELLYVLDGAGTLETGGKLSMTLNRGTVTRLDAMPHHTVRNASRTRTLRILVVFALAKGQQHPLLAHERGQEIWKHGTGHQEPTDFGLVF